MSEFDNNKKIRATVLGYPVDITTLNSAIDSTNEYITGSKGAHVVTLNPEMIFQANKDKVLEDTIKSADIVLPDGIGVVLGLKILGKKTKRIPGIEYSEKLLELCAQNNYKVAFLGASDDVITIAVKKLKEKLPNLNVVYKRDGFFNKNEELNICKEIEKADPDVLFVALGVPKQELWINDYKKILNRTIIVGVGGSFDVWSQKIQRAPEAFRKLGLEWFFRLITQPSRFKRMFPTLPLFLLKVINERFKTL